MKGLSDFIIDALELAFDVLKANAIIDSIDASFKSFVTPRRMLNCRAKTYVAALTQRPRRSTKRYARCCAIICVA